MVESSTPVPNDKSQANEPEQDRFDISQLPVAALVVANAGDDTATVIDANDAAVRLYGADPTGLALARLVPERVRSSHPRLAASLLNRGQQRTIEASSGLPTSIVCADGSETPVSIGVSPDPETGMAIVTLVEATAREQLDAVSAELHLKQAQLDLEAQRGDGQESVLRFGVFAVIYLVTIVVVYGSIAQPENGAEIIREVTVLAITNIATAVSAYAIGRKRENSQ